MIHRIRYSGRKCFLAEQFLSRRNIQRQVRTILGYLAICSSSAFATDGPSNSLGNAPANAPTNAPVSAQTDAGVDQSKAIGSIEFRNPLIQGHLIYAKAKPGASVKVLGKTVVADEQGDLVFGIGRDLETIDIEVGGVQQSFMVAPREYRTQKINGVNKKYVSPPKETLDRIKKENAAIGRARRLSSDLRFFKDNFELPAEGPITGVYGSQRVFNGVPKRPHFGLDIAGPIGTPILAPVGGKVVYANPDMYFSGGTIVIDHGRGVTSTFIHLDKLHVEQGQMVAQGDKIADMGATGRVTGPHLDWRMNWFNQRVDPAPLIERFIDPKSGQLKSFKPQNDPA